MKQKTVRLPITNINSVIVLTPYWLQKLLGKHLKGSRELRAEISERKTPAPFSSTMIDLLSSITQKIILHTRRSEHHSPPTKERKSCNLSDFNKLNDISLANSRQTKLLRDSDKNTSERADKIDGLVISNKKQSGHIEPCDKHR